MNRRRRILVVDDQSDILELTSMVLRGAGYEVVALDSGAEAVERVAGERFDLVLLDINMPEMDGWETLRLMRADDLLTGLPIVMFSIKGELRDQVQSMQEGAVDYISKPFEVDGLLSRVQRILEQPAMTSTPEQFRTRYLKLKSVVYDRATGLPSFPVLLDRLRCLLEDRSCIGVLAVTIDQLDLVESLYGWQVLDRILARVALVLQEAKGAELPADVLLAVNGVAGDRFAVFLPTQQNRPEVDGAFLAQAGQQLRRRLDRSFGGDGFVGLSPKLSFRVGHALLAHDPFYRFERRVYAALEQASSFEQRRDKRRDLSWNEELQKILDGGALDTLFQPVVDLHTQEVLGYEALSRGPKDTLFEKPQAMFALSRRVGASEDLDRQCRRAALKATVSIDRRRKIFLNALPPREAENRSRQEELLRELEEVALKPGDLVFEFSDRAAEGDTDRLIKAIAHLKQSGFGVALDDVGTGYASQAVFESACPNYLKLDISLVRGIDANLIKQELLHSLVRIAGRIGAEVIAEGVETEGEARTLREAGTRYAQGFLFAKPAPAGRREH